MEAQPVTEVQTTKAGIPTSFKLDGTTHNFDCTSRFGEQEFLGFVDGNKYKLATLEVSGKKWTLNS